MAELAILLPAVTLTLMGLPRPLLVLSVITALGNMLSCPLSIHFYRLSKVGHLKI